MSRGAEVINPRNSRPNAINTMNELGDTFVIVIDVSLI